MSHTTPAMMNEFNIEDAKSAAQMRALLLSVEDRISELDGKIEWWNEQMEKVAESVKDVHPRVTFDVRETRFVVPKSVLLTQPNSYFGALLQSGRFKPTESDTIVIDRDPQYFGLIMDILRGRTLDTRGMDYNTLMELREEIDYYQDFMNQFLDMIVHRNNLSLPPLKVTVHCDTKFHHFKSIVKTFAREELADQAIPPKLYFRFRRMAQRKNGTKRPAPQIYKKADRKKTMRELSLHLRQMIYLEQGTDFKFKNEREDTPADMRFLHIKKWDEIDKRPRSIADVTIPSTTTLTELKEFVMKEFPDEVGTNPEAIVVTEEETEGILNDMKEDDKTLIQYKILSGDIIHIELNTDNVVTGYFSKKQKELYVTIEETAQSFHNRRQSSNDKRLRLSNILMYSDMTSSEIYRTVCSATNQNNIRVFLVDTTGKVRCQNDIPYLFPETKKPEIQIEILDTKTCFVPGCVVVRMDFFDRKGEFIYNESYEFDKSTKCSELYKRAAARMQVPTSEIIITRQNVISRHVECVLTDDDIIAQANEMAYGKVRVDHVSHSPHVDGAVIFQAVEHRVPCIDEPKIIVLQPNATAGDVINAICTKHGISDTLNVKWPREAVSLPIYAEPDLAAMLYTPEDLTAPADLHTLHVVLWE